MVARVPLLMAAPLLGLICMGIADCSAFSAGEAGLGQGYADFSTIITAAG